MSTTTTARSHFQTTTEFVITQQLCFALQGTANVGPMRLGVDLWLVREVLATRPIEAVPSTPEAILGTFYWRRRTIPVMDILRVLGKGEVAPSPRNRLLILQKRDGVVAYLVSQVLGIARTVGSLGPVPPGLDPGLFRGSTLTAFGRVLLFNAEAI